MVELILYFTAFVLLSGVMAMTDAAVLSISAAEIEAMAAAGKPGAMTLRKLHGHLTRAVVVIVILTNTVNVLGPVLVGNKAVELYGSVVLGAITAILTFTTIVLSEIVPKSIGVHYAPLVSRMAAPAILIVSYAILPLVLALDLFSSIFRKGRRPIGTEAQIRSLARIGSRAGLIEKEESQLIQRTFVLNDKTAGDIMVGAEEIVWLDHGMSIAEAAKKLLHEKYSRFPVFGSSRGDIRGLVISQDVLDAVTTKRAHRSVGAIAREILKIRGTERLDELLLLFRDRKTHMALVIDGGETVGLVTLEDVLEELVGEIEDETDHMHS